MAPALLHRTVMRQHKGHNKSVQKKHRDGAREPDDLKERSSTVAARRADKDVVPIDDDDIIASVDLDAAPEGDGPDA